MIYLKNFKVTSFRGIKNLEVEDIGNINIIVGDNNSGKTSVLEAIMLLRNTKEFTNVVSVARLRENSFYSPFRTSVYDNFLFMFDQTTDIMKIGVEGNISGKEVGMNLTGTIEKIMVDYSDLNDRGFSRAHGAPDSETVGDDTEINAFIGKLTNTIYDINGKQVTEWDEIKYHQYTRITGTRISNPYIVDMAYVSPTDHNNGNVFGRIVRNDSYKEIVLKVLQLFDKDIEDLLYLKSDQTARPIEYIKHGKLGNMPLLTYGDGIKKVLLLANSIAKAQGGILLIDEIETAIHAKYYDDIFKFIIKACMQFNIQLFATTHSIEAVDAILATQYNQNKEVYDATNKDLIRVITFRQDKKKNKSLARVLSGKEVFENRNNFGFEVRT
jgi:AAA15 family ATPase/GTPase